MKHFKVKIGFGKNDFISIDESELALALRAQINGKVAIFKEGTVSGNNIIAITPDYNKALGFNPTYELTSEDYGLISKQEVNGYRDLIESKKAEIYNETKRIG